MKSIRSILVVATVVGLAAVACERSTPMGEDAPAGTVQTAPAARVVSAPVAGTADRGYAFPLRVMTRNIYLGASITPLLTAPSAQLIPGLVAEMWVAVQATDFPSRAVRLAEEIDRQQPHVIGLQEAALYRIQSPGDFFVGNPQAATEVVYDFVEILQAELVARGLDYTAVVVRTGSDVELPSLTGDDLRLTDRQAILVRSDIEVLDSAQGTYAVNLTVPVGGEGGPPVTLSRGWVSVDARVAGRAMRFVCTHLERGSVEPVQLAQGAELLQILGAAQLPVVVLGDFNSAADGSRTATYGTLVAGGLVDAWSLARQDVGYTCCLPDEPNAPSELNRRIDLVFIQEPGDVAEPTITRAHRATMVGADPEQRTASGLWPSDHAGVAITLAVDATRQWLASRPRASTGTLRMAVNP
jgi:endonuclease/exonuclease/phosphatase family metal-dependent hydrolase